MYVCMYGRTRAADDGLRGLRGEGGHHRAVFGHRAEYHRGRAHHLTCHTYIHTFSVSNKKNVCMYVWVMVTLTDKTTTIQCMYVSTYAS